VRGDWQWQRQRLHDGGLIRSWAPGRLGPISLNPLPMGTLAALDAQRLVRRGGANEQFKHQFLYTKPGDEADFPVASAAAAGECTSAHVDAPTGTTAVRDRDREIP
jgi:hypothetical protein